MNEAVLKQKEQAVSELTDKLKNSGSAVVVEYRGLTVAETTELRRMLRAENVEMSVLKNNIIKRAVDGLDCGGLDDVLKGPNALVLGKDAVAPARLLAKYAKKHKNLVLKGGIVDRSVVDSNGILELSKLPNKEGMISMFAGCLTYPVSSFARALKAVADHKGGAEAPASETAA